jgi:methionine synthase II (cobalamin-independent)
VILGIFTTKDAQLEDLAELKSRVLEATDIIATAQKTSQEDALQRVGVSPQCGFASASDVGEDAVVDGFGKGYLGRS